MTVTLSQTMEPKSYPEMPRQRLAPMVDPFGRAVTYLRVSVTDRCDFRCTYCMAENMLLICAES